MSGKIRKPESGLNIKVYDKLASIDREVWDAIVPPDHVICTYNYVRAMEESGVNNCRYRFLLVYDGETLVAHTYFYAMSFDLDIFDSGVSARFINFVRRKFAPEFFRIKVVECGTPTALGNTITVVDGYDKREILSLITRAMASFAVERKSRILIFRDFYAQDMCYTESLRQQGFKRVRMLPNMEVVNNWDSFEHYVRDMRSRYRYRLRKFMRTLDKNGVTIEVRDHFADIAGELLELWNQIYAHAKEYKREVLTPEYFINMDKYLGDRSKVVLFKKAGKTIAFDFIIIDDNTLRPLFIGLDYKYNEENKLYFNILCQSVKMGIELQKESIEMGITTIGPKKEIGAEIVPTFGYMKHLHPLANVVVTNLFAAFAPPEYKDRKNVFTRRYYERIYADFKLQLVVEGQKYPVRVVNLSEKGIRVVSPVIPGKRGKRILLVGFYLHESKIFFNVFGKIVWIREGETNYSIGIRFVRLHPQLREKLSHLTEYYKLQEEHGEN